jgi:hypothetical protein
MLSGLPAAEVREQAAAVIASRARARVKAGSPTCWHAGRMVVGTHYRPDYRLLGLRALPPTTLAQCGLLTIRGAGQVIIWRCNRLVVECPQSGQPATEPRRPRCLAPQTRAQRQA